MVVWFQSRRVEPLRQKASRYQMSKWSPANFALRIVSMLFVHAIVIPSAPRAACVPKPEITATSRTAADAGTSFLWRNDFGGRLKKVMRDSTQAARSRQARKETARGHPAAYDSRPGTRNQLARP